MRHELDTFFNPKSIAVIGASTKEEKVGNIIFKNLLRAKGLKIFAVNPNSKTVLRRKSYSSVLDIKEKVDLAILTIPSFVVPQMVQECVEATIPSVVVISAGFSESGETALERKVRDIVQWKKTRVIGPNCLGVYTPSKVTSLFLAMDRLTLPDEGGVSIVSQSGSIGVMLLEHLERRNIGISKFVSYGNSADVTESDLLEYMIQDKSTDVVLLVLEAVRNGEKFLKVCKKSHKPIIVYKAGKNERSKQALQSHTGSIATDSKIYSGVFKQSNIVEVEDWKHLSDFAALHLSKLPEGRRFLIVSNGGGFGVVCADHAFNHNLLLPKPSDKLLSKLNYSHKISMLNPIDLTGDANPEHFLKVVEAASNGKEYAGIIVVPLLQVATMSEKLIKGLISLKKKSRIPIYVVLHESKSREKFIESLQKAKIPVFEDSERLIKAISLVLNS